MDAILEPLVSSPSFLHHLEQLQQIAEAEQQRRARFLEEITPEAKWEFINGEVIMHSPATNKHTAIRERLGKLVHTYVVEHQLGWCGGEKVLVSLRRNDYEPDYNFFGSQKAQQFTDDLMRHPAPDLAVEILSESTESRDRGIKWKDYAAHGVQEYWIIDPWQDTLEQYLLKGAEYVLKMKATEGSVHSQAIQGLSIPIRAFFDDAECQLSLRSLLRK